MKTKKSKYDHFHPGETLHAWAKRLRVKLCEYCGCPMKPKDVEKNPDEWDHASGCPLAGRALFRPRFPEMKEQCASCPFARGNDRELDAVLSKLAAAEGVPEENRLPVTVSRAMVKMEAARSGDFICHGTAYDSEMKLLEPSRRRQCPGATEWHRTHLPKDAKR